MQYLTTEQLNRLYFVFEFDDHEQITGALFDDNKLYIYYVDADNEDWTYEPDLDLTNDEDIKKLNYILKGEYTL